jgi:hypothetical protein
LQARRYSAKPNFKKSNLNYSKKVLFAAKRMDITIDLQVIKMYYDDKNIFCRKNKNYSLKIENLNLNLT